jgi:hypothetical protein
LQEADIILLLVSADFIASDYCWGTEVRRQCRGLWVFDRLWVVPVFDYCG